MTERLLSGMPPQRVLLAIDLSGRGDRAFDRAMQLTRAWGAELHIVHAVQTPPPPRTAADEGVAVDATTYPQNQPNTHAGVARQLRSLVDHSGLTARLHIEDAPPAQAILDVAEREACDLLILGESSNRLSNIIESTLVHVTRKAQVSVLVVRNRPHAAYQSLLVGTDFSDEAQQALVVAARLFPDASIALMHAYQTPYSGMLQNAPNNPELIAEQLAQLRAHLHDADLPRERKQSIRTLVAFGPPAAVLQRHVEDKAIDLTVIGAHPRGMLFDAVVGSSRAILEVVPGDILMVRAIRRDVES